MAFVSLGQKVHRYVSPDSEPVLGWRPALGQAVPGTQWTLEEKLGEGAFGEVWLGRHQTLKERRVFKFCFRADRVRPLKREITLFRLLKERAGEHPNIVKVHDVYLDEPPFYLVMEYVEGRDLRSWCEAQGGVEKIPLATRLEIVAQVAEALQAAHDAGVIHRDVKPTNVLISQPSTLNAQPTAKLTDFGIGQVVSQEALAGLTKLGFTQTLMPAGSSAQAGTTIYMAPELLAGKPASAQSDIYALGVVLYQFLSGDFSRPLTMDWPRDIEEPRLADLLANCYPGNPQERFATCRDLADSLRSIKNRIDALVWRRKALKPLQEVGWVVLGFSGLFLVVGNLIAVAKWAMALGLSHNKSPVTQSVLLRDIPMWIAMAGLGGFALILFASIGVHSRFPLHSRDDPLRGTACEDVHPSLPISDQARSG